MAINFSFRGGTTSCQANTCPSQCPTDICPDFIIKRHDVRPPFKVAIEDCDGPIDLSGLVIEVSMWLNARLKTAIDTEDTYFGVADNIGFDQVMVGDIIIMTRPRSPEHMLVTAFDEDNKLIQVQRGYHGTTISNWKKGSGMKIFRTLGAVASSEMVLEDIVNVEGQTDTDVLTSSLLVYEFSAVDTCLAGCFWLEFKVLKMLGLTLFLPGGTWTGPTHQNDDGFYFSGTDETSSSVPLSYDSVNDRFVIPDTLWSGDYHTYSANYYTGLDHDDGSVYLNRTGIPSTVDVLYNADGVVSSLSLADPSVIPTFTDPDLTPADFGCSLGVGVEWVRRFPVDREGFLIKIIESPTSEL